MNNYNDVDTGLVDSATVHQSVLTNLVKFELVFWKVCAKVCRYAYEGLYNVVFEKFFFPMFIFVDRTSGKI